MKFIEKINTIFLERHDLEKTKIEFVVQGIFDIDTYDSELDNIFFKKMIDVIDCILKRTTFDYQKESKENYINFVTMVNFPFLKDKIEWGTSIRGCWFDTSLDGSYTFFCDLEVYKNEIEIFLNDLIDWLKL